MNLKITSEDILEGCRPKEEITELIIPDGVKRIGEYAFRRYGNLKKVIIPDSVTSIGEGAFQYCTSLTHAEIPESVTSIGGWAFYQCKNLEHVTIPESVTSIGRGAFEDTSWLEHHPDDFVIVNQILIKYKGQNPQPIIPEGIKEIGAGAFDGCKTLKSVRIPESVTSIGKSAFCDCWTLERITIPETVTNIGAHAFYQTPWVRHQSDFVIVNHILVEYRRTWDVPEVMQIPDGVYAIADEVFCYGVWDDKTNTHIYPAMKKLILPEGLKVIGERSFGSCKYLEEIQFPESIEKIGYGAFNQSKLLKRMPYIAHEGKVFYRFLGDFYLRQRNLEYMKNAEYMIQNQDYEVEIYQQDKYDLIFQMFTLDIDTEGTGQYIRKHFQEMIPVFFRLEDTALLQKMFEHLPDLMQEYIDILIQEAIKQKKHILQIMLTDYKYQHCEFRKKDWSL